MGAYVPYKPGYGHTFAGYPSPSNPTGITPVGVAGSCMGENVSRPCNWENATLGTFGAYDRGGGNPSPYYPLSGYGDTGNPTLFRPMDAFAGSDNGSMPMEIGVGQDRIGGVQPMGFWLPLVTAGLGLAAIAGATYVAKSGVDKALSPETAQYISKPVVQTTGNIATIAIVGLIGYMLFRKDIEKLIK